MITGHVPEPHLRESKGDRNRNDPYRGMLVRGRPLSDSRRVARGHCVPLLAVPPDERTLCGHDERAIGKYRIDEFRSPALV
jgi:hypothetical protein